MLGARIGFGKTHKIFQIVLLVHIQHTLGFSLSSLHVSASLLHRLASTHVCCTARCARVVEGSVQNGNHAEPPSAASHATRGTSCAASRLLQTRQSPISSGCRNQYSCTFSPRKRICFRDKLARKCNMHGHEDGRDCFLVRFPPRLVR